jgi:hypothetical protein
MSYYDDVRHASSGAQTINSCRLTVMVNNYRRSFPNNNLAFEVSMLLRNSIPLLGLAALLSSNSASAYSRSELGEAIGNLQQQVAKLSAQGASSCPSEHKRLNSVSSLKMSLYYGYEDYESATADGVHSAAMVYALKAPCAPNVQACGFRQVAKTANMTRLSKKVGSRLVTLSIYHTSITSNNEANTGELKAQQDARGAQMRAQFNSDLINNDVVFYAGHSRYGSGLGFDSPDMAKDVGNFVFRFPLRPMADALRVRPSRLKVLGLFACKANSHYRYVVEGANPNTNLILSHDDIESDEGEQQQLGAINSILTNKCDAEFQDSLVSTVAPGHNVMEYVRRPE